MLFMLLVPNPGIGISYGTAKTIRPPSHLPVPLPLDSVRIASPYRRTSIETSRRGISHGLAPESHGSGVSICWP